MESNTIEMKISHDGYRNMAGMFICNVLENVKTRKDWTIQDASFLLLGAMKIARSLPDDEFALLISSIDKRYNG